MNADQIRRELSGLAQIRAGLEANLEQVRNDSAVLLDKARKAKMPMSEAAALLDLSRVSAYELLKRRS